ncbi:MAG: hypothetical protein ACK5NK_13710 [Niabella sp.]
MNLKNAARQTIVGFIFAIPFLAVFLIVEKIWIRFSKLSKKVGLYFGNESPFSAYAETIVLLILFLLFFYFIGALKDSHLSARLRKAIEKRFLEYIPGYWAYKNKMEQTLTENIQSGKKTADVRKAVYYLTETGKKPGILIEQKGTESLIFFPFIPDTNNGEIIILPNHVLMFEDMPVEEFIELLQHSGKGLLVK